MSKSINFNEVRRLAKQAAKKRPVLEQIMYKDGVAYFTDSYYLVVAKVNDDHPNVLVNVTDYTVGDIYNYPELSKIIDKPFTKKPHQDIIIEGQVVHRYERINLQGERVVSYLDQEIIKQVEKLVSIKGFKLNVNELELNEYLGMARLKLKDETSIYFVLTKKYLEKEQDDE